MSFYRLSLTPDDNGSFLVTSSDFPELTTFGESRDDAIRQGEAAVEEALAARIADGRPLPRFHTVARPGAPAARISYAVQVKVGLVQALQDSGITRAELSRRLDWHREQVDRLFRFDHVSKPDQVQAAFNALGYEIRLGFTRRKQAA